MLLQVAPVAAATESLSRGNLIGSILVDSDPIIKLTLFILACFSIGSWAIIFLKMGQLRLIRRKVNRFTAHLLRAKSLELFLPRGTKGHGPGPNILRACVAPIKNGQTAHNKSLVSREAGRAVHEELEQLEAYLPFLATTASATPFIGLFGTCWGILNAFFEISAAGSSSLQVVGPRIAEALFTTAIGLAAAIPAVVFYNYFINRTQKLFKDIERLAEDVTDRIEREYFAA